MKKFNEPSLRAKLENLMQVSESEPKTNDLFIEISGEKYPLKQPKILAEKARVDELKQ